MINTTKSKQNNQNLYLSLLLDHPKMEKSPIPNQPYSKTLAAIFIKKSLNFYKFYKKLSIFKLWIFLSCCIFIIKSINYEYDKKYKISRKYDS
jgi:hypothetical protein